MPWPDTLDMPTYVEVRTPTVLHPVQWSDGQAWEGECLTRRPKARRERFKLITPCSCGAYLIEWQK